MKLCPSNSSFSETAMSKKFQKKPLSRKMLSTLNFSSRRTSTRRPRKKLLSCSHLLSLIQTAIFVIVIPWQFPQEEPTETREDIQDNVDKKDSDVDWEDCDLDEEVADVHDSTLNPVRAKLGDSETQEAVPDNNTQEAILETANVNLSLPGNPLIIAATTVEEEVGRRGLRQLCSRGCFLLWQLSEPLEEADELQTVSV